MKKIYTMCLAALMMTSVNEANAITVDDLVGDYVETTSGYDFWNWWTWEPFDYSGGVTITKVDDTTIAMQGLLNWWNDTDGDGNYDALNTLNGTVDFEAGTITFQPQYMETPWYTFCATNWDDTAEGYTADQPVIATFDVETGIITINNWSMVYQSYLSSYSNASTTLYKYDRWAEGSYDTGKFNTDKEVDGTAWIYGLKDGSYLITEMLPNGKYLRFVPGEDGTWGDPWGTYYADRTYGEYYFYGMFKEDRVSEEFTNEDGSELTLKVVIDDYLYVLDNKFNFDPENGELSFDYEYYYSANSAKPEYEGTYKLTWTTSGGDDTDGIASVKTGNGIEAPVYNLSGVKVADNRNALPRGLYISDGKKFVVK